MILLVFSIKAKIGMQPTFMAKRYVWDEELLREVCYPHKRIFDQSERLNEVAFLRSLTSKVLLDRQFCAFSPMHHEKRLGTCAYVRWDIGAKIYDVRFVAAKSRVAPLKELSIPRLELQAAVLATRLYNLCEQ